MSPKSIKFFTGAPLASSLDWREEGLLNGFSSAFQRYLADDIIKGPPPTPVPSQAVPKWRVVPLHNHTFYESPILQRSLLFKNQNSSHRLDKALPKNDSLLGKVEDHDFLDHSFAVHADLQSSQIAQPHDDDTLDHLETTFLTEDSITSTMLENSTDLSLLPANASIVGDSTVANIQHRSIGPIMSIKAIPNAEHLQRLQPQTMTVNVVVGVISIAPARTVRVRKGGYDMEIIEIMVADETKAGFAISSWHVPQTSQQKIADELRKTLMSLRPQDIILVERVALCSFRDQVFGQSLNRRATKNTTSITVLHKAQQTSFDDSEHSVLPPIIASKLERVIDWVSSFVGPRAKRKAKMDTLPQPLAKCRRQAALVEEEFLPADSQ